MTAHEDYWLAMSRGARVMDLDRAESLRLLAAKKVGRLAFVNDGVPMIMPMNFTLAGERVIIRTLAHGSGARAVNTAVAFEVDDIDDFLEAGWSVVVTAELLSEAELDQLRSTAPEPWAEGPRTLFLAIPVEHVTGRQLVPH
jgi:nitroimidazol reductase NimA-like FMN-containing flavoprotein (pyridoxamine 5'-phosphate oxidase superfamily)